MEPANKSYPEAEYECLIVAIDPDRCPKPDPDSEEGYPYLIPMDIEEQFHGISDADASRIGELVVRTILSGGLSPDEEQAAYWHRQIQSWVYKIASGKMAMN